MSAIMTQQDRLTLTDNVSIADPMRFGAAEGCDRYTVFCKDPDGVVAEEIDIDVRRGTRRGEINRAAAIAVGRELVEGCTVGDIVGPRVGLYL